MQKGESHAKARRTQKGNQGKGNGTRRCGERGGLEGNRRWAQMNADLRHAEEGESHAKPRKVGEDETRQECWRSSYELRDMVEQMSSWLVR